MGFKLACKAFFKAFRNTESAKEFLKEDTAPQLEQKTKEDPSHLHLLSLLQKSGRLIDFLKEDITNFSDTQIGGAVRQVHNECSKLLEELVTVRPVMEESEGSEIHVPVGFDPSTTKVIGNVKGSPPYKGKLVHKGWKAHKRSLPKKVGDSTGDVIAPAEIEVS